VVGLPYNLIKISPQLVEKYTANCHFIPHFLMVVKHPESVKNMDSTKIYTVPAMAMPNPSTKLSQNPFITFQLFSQQTKNNQTERPTNRPYHITFYFDYFLQFG